MMRGRRKHTEQDRKGLANLNLGTKAAQWAWGPDQIHQFWVECLLPKRRRAEAVLLGGGWGRWLAAAHLSEARDVRAALSPVTSPRFSAEDP